MKEVGRASYHGHEILPSLVSIPNTRKMSLSALKTNMALSLSSLNTPKDILLPADAQDTISSLAWAPRPSSNFLAAASWDGKIRVYDVAADGSRAKRIEERMIGGGAPVLSCDWLKVGSSHMLPFIQKYQKTSIHERKKTTSKSSPNQDSGTIPSLS